MICRNTQYVSISLDIYIRTIKNQLSLKDFGWMGGGFPVPPLHRKCIFAPNKHKNAVL